MRCCLDMGCAAQRGAACQLFPGVSYTIQNKQYTKNEDGTEKHEWMKESITVIPEATDTDRAVKFLRYMLTLQFCFITCDENEDITVMSSSGPTINGRYHVTITIGENHTLTTSTDDIYYYAVLMACRWSLNSKRIL